ncbi:MAG: hypothetical protein ACLP9L_31760 [Thermoguttaceae bacterium]
MIRLLGSKPRRLVIDPLNRRLLLTATSIDTKRTTANSPYMGICDVEDGVMLTINASVSVPGRLLINDNESGRGLAAQGGDPAVALEPVTRT